MKARYLTYFLLLFCISVSAQTDSTVADSLIFSSVKAHYTEKTDKKIPSDSELVSFFQSKGVVFDPECSRLDLYREIYGWLGVKYKYAGLTKSGVDCAGFVKNICNPVYGTKLSGSAGDHFNRCIPIEREDLEEGDLVFFKINKTYISHIGIYLGNGKFAHAAVHGGVMINDLSEEYYNKYYYISGRLKSNG
ncbi:MAG: C40 family peptidase [Bacteroidota bacterium]